MIVLFAVYLAAIDLFDWCFRKESYFDRHHEPVTDESEEQFAMHYWSVVQPRTRQWVATRGAELLRAGQFAQHAVEQRQLYDNHGISP